MVTLTATDGPLGYHGDVRCLLLISVLLAAGCERPLPMAPADSGRPDSRSTDPETIPGFEDTGACPRVVLSEVVSSNRDSLIWEAGDDTNIDIDIAGSISHAYARLRLNEEFRARYSERAALHLGPGGALSADAATARWEARSAEIQDAIVAESARWGDTDREPPYTRDVEWMDERTRLMEEFFPYRSQYLEEQLIGAGLMEP